QALRIRQRLLESFEAGDFKFPDFAPIQIRGFIRNYARYLGLDEDRIVAYYEEALVETNSKRLSGRETSAPPKKRKDKRDNTPIPVAPRSITDTPPSLPAVVITTPTEARRKTSLGTVLLRLLIAVAAVAVIAYVVVQLVQTDTNPPPSQDGGDILNQL